MKTAADSVVTSPGTRNSVLVDPQWLEEHLGDPNVRVIEVDVSRAAYDSWHIDGAVLWNIYSDLKDSSYQLMDRAALAGLVARSGVQANSTVVFYGYGPALGVWLLKLYGHADARILDCSRDTWRAAGRPWSTTTTNPAPGTLRLGKEDLGLRADHLTVRKAIGQLSTTIVDVRTEAEYSGERFWPSGGMEPGGRAGHVPTAIHLPLDGIYHDDGSFCDTTDLRRIFSAVDLDSDAELVTYCTIGGRAATAWFVLTYLLGRDRVRVYDGSWAEWGRMTDTPVDR